MRYCIFSDNTSDFLCIHQIGYSENPNITRFGPGCRNKYIIHYVIDGKGYYNGNPVCGGQGFLIYPGQKEVYYPSKENPWKFLWIIAAGESMNSIFGRYNADSETKIFSYNDIPLLKETAEYIINNHNKVISSPKITEQFLHIANSHISENIPKQNKSNADIYTDFCVKYIEENIHKKITVYELTEILGISQAYLYTIFRNRFNMSIKKYITFVKHNYAKKLLKTTPLTIQEISNSLGYDDVFVFSKVFKSQEGVSPSHFRKISD